MNAGLSLVGGADGIFGSATAGAVMEFQRQKGLSVTGVVDDATAAALTVAPGAAPAAPSADGIKLDAFPVQGKCYYGDTFGFPRSGGRTHEGVDILAAKGHYTYAVAAGTITKVYTDYPGSLSGNGVRLTTADGTYYFYAHFDTFADGIAVGTKVVPGQILGTVGETGDAGTPHLHFEVHPKGGAALNPTPIVKAVDACKVTDVPAQP
jgi:murein DD-endopeptidase MepM/ murein hydrolase activator NlpD